MAGIPNKANIGEGVRGVSTADIKTGAVTTAKVGALAVTTGKLGAGAVTTAKLGSLAVTTGKIRTGAVTKAKIAASMFREAIRTGVASNTAITITGIAVGDTICGAARIVRTSGVLTDVTSIVTITTNTIKIATQSNSPIANVHVLWQDRT